MLQPAKRYESELALRFADIMLDEAYMYADASVYRDDYEPLRTTWESHEFVSVSNEGDVIGYISYRIQRETSKVYSWKILNFEKEKFSPVFGRDLMQAIVDIFTKFNMNAMNFSVVVGNPAEQMYDRRIERMGGRVVGVYKDDVRLIDNKVYDLKMYEVMRKDFMESELFKKWEEAK